MGTPLRACWLGPMAFDAALALQTAARDAVVEEREDPILFLVEHPAVLTVGRRGSQDDILWTDAQLEAEGVGVSQTPRGGQVTLHAPGQLVAYPVVPIGRQIRAHLHHLAETSIALVEELGVEGAEFRMDHPGVWVGDVKLGSIGVHISRGVTVQGLSLNLRVDPKLFGALVSCGIEGLRMQSVADLVDEVPTVEVAARRWAELWAARTAADLRWVESPAEARGGV
ncbi:MAG: lipoyl(octanoyl) transferase LipB [Nannocystaceae bacterium]|nr:lipoyl(octanoyl) transferase LipB [bacterium]